MSFFDDQLAAADGLFQETLGDAIVYHRGADSLGFYAIPCQRGNGTADHPATQIELDAYDWQFLMTELAAWSPDDEPQPGDWLEYDGQRFDLAETDAGYWTPGDAAQRWATLHTTLTGPV